MTLPDNPGASAPSSPALRQGSGSASDPGSSSSTREIWNQVDQSSIMSMELLAAILTWGGLGWLLDRWLGTMPVFFGIGVIVGFAAGLYLVWYRSGKDQQYPDGARRAPGSPDRTEGR
jgi:F0F1-type ATP synthase assembly protein I